MIPAPFRSLRVLRVLNVAAVGPALAAVVSALFLLGPKDVGALALATGVPTWLLGTLWALILRWPKTVAGTSFRWGWAASVPLAVLNSAIAGSLAVGFSAPNDPASFALGAVLGATFGALFWVPGLIVTLVCFGLPIASAHRLAAKGLAGEERGEKLVGLACVAMSLIGLTLALAFGRDVAGASHWVPYALAGAGAVAGSAAAFLAHAREARRRLFVSRAEAGEIAGYRVDPTDEGKVLVRIVSHGEGYRVADFEEQVFELGAEGEATRPRFLAGAPRS